MNHRNLRQAEKLYKIYKNNARLNYSIDFLSQQVFNASITLKVQLWHHTESKK